LIFISIIKILLTSRIYEKDLQAIPKKAKKYDRPKTVCH